MDFKCFRNWALLNYLILRWLNVWFRYGFLWTTHTEFTEYVGHLSECVGDQKHERLIYKCTTIMLEGLVFSFFSKIANVNLQLSFGLRLDDEARRLFEELGSTAVKELAFRDSWVFVGAKGIEDKSPFEQVGSSCYWFQTTPSLPALLTCVNQWWPS